MIPDKPDYALVGLMAIVVMMLSLSCNGGTHNEDIPFKSSADTVKEGNYFWVKHTDSAAFPESYNFQLIALHDTLWAFHPAGNWYSVDGTKWEKSALPNIIHNLAFLDYIAFNNAVYGLGYFEGNIETFRFRPEIWKTEDLHRWVKLSENSNLPDRFFYHPFVFQQKIWIIGGSDKHKSYQDIWNSADGIHWERVNAKADFGPRENSHIVERNDTLFLLNNDVWYSVNGIDWHLITREIIPGVEIFGYAALVYDNRIWLLGCNRNGQFTSKVLSSADGKNWQESDAPWSPRGGVAACVFKNRIFMTGGKYGGADISQPDFQYSNDVWSMGGKGQ